MKKIRGAVILLFIFSCFLLPQISFAKDNFWNVSFDDISSLNVNININEQGDASVEKQFNLISPSTTFTWSEDLSSKKIIVESDGKPLSKKEYKIKKEQERYIINAETKNQNSSWTIKYSMPTAIILNNTANFDQIQLPMIIEPGVFINNLSIVVNLPKQIDQSGITQRVYAIHGVEKYDFTVENDQTLIYSGENLSPSSIYTISAAVPKNTFSFSLFKKISLYFRFSIFNFWLTVAIILPAFAFAFYLYMIVKKRREENIVSTGYLDKPPDDLSPAVLGVLLRQQVSGREIVATIVDLTARGYIEIIKKHDEFVLGKRQGKGALNPHEAFLYDKLFTQQGVRKIKRTEVELEERAQQQLYSPKITQFYETIYQEGQKRHYFVKSPAMVILKYRAYGIIFFLLAVGLALVASKLSSGAPYAIFGAMGLMVASLLIIKAAPLMPKRTKKGAAELKTWSAFGKYLSDKRPLRAVAIEERIYEKYLPYAIALGKEIDWTKRFSETVYVPPPWYTTEESVTIENLAGSLFYITGSLSKTLHELREPNL